MLLIPDSLTKRKPPARVGDVHQEVVDEGER